MKHSVTKKKSNILYLLLSIIVRCIICFGSTYQADAAEVVPDDIKDVATSYLYDDNYRGVLVQKETITTTMSEGQPKLDIVSEWYLEPLNKTSGINYKVDNINFNSENNFYVKNNTPLGSELPEHVRVSLDEQDIDMSLEHIDTLTKEDGLDNGVTINIYAIRETDLPESQWGDAEAVLVNDVPIHKNEGKVRDSTSVSYSVKNAEFKITKARLVSITFPSQTLGSIKLNRVNVSQHMRGTRFGMPLSPVYHFLPISFFQEKSTGNLKIYVLPGDIISISGSTEVFYLNQFAGKRNVSFYMSVANAEIDAKMTLTGSLDFETYKEKLVKAKDRLLKTLLVYDHGDSDFRNSIEYLAKERTLSNLTSNDVNAYEDIYNYTGYMNAVASYIEDYSDKHAIDNFQLSDATSQSLYESLDQLMDAEDRYANSSEKYQLRCDWRTLRNDIAEKLNTVDGLKDLIKTFIDTEVSKINKSKLTDESKSELTNILKEAETALKSVDDVTALQGLYDRLFDVVKKLKYKQEPVTPPIPTTIKGEIGPNNPVALTAVTKAFASMKKDGDIKGSSYRYLKLKSAKQTTKSIKLSWSKVKGAKSYTVYANLCGKNKPMKKLATTTRNAYNAKKILGKKLKKNKFYKFAVVAHTGNKAVAISKTIHVTTKAKGVANYQKVVVKKAVITKAKSFQKGKSLKLNAKAIFPKKTKSKNHVKVRYESSNKKIATVSTAGKIKALKKGKCYVWAYAQNRISKKILVNVK